ncbi:MAG TPA: GNAT family N-acetyltransferase [Feifaniaceae bacterium]|nr:GNAT family N-acetyltransferase [Feifaniaceae bacterium]
MYTVYETDRLLLKALGPSQAELTLDYYSRNRAFLEEWEPVREEAFYTLQNQRESLTQDQADMEGGRLFRAWIFKKEEEGRAIGTFGFSNIVRGAFWSCFLGYKLDGKETCKGYMTEALGKGISIMFDEYGLHRIEANIMPKNKASLRVAEKLGFLNEGLSRKYLKINGVWEDHIHMVLLNDKA